jgi:glycerol-3-phosphate acyltransferase PlsY
MLILFYHLASFLVGAIPVGYLIGRARGIDIRAEGSGNTGATNAGRVLGKKVGIITLLLDVLKGTLPVVLANFFLLVPGNLNTMNELIPASLGLTAIFGHCFSPFVGFKGGKGVATSLGVFLALRPIESSLALLVFLVVFRLSRYVSLSSISAAAAMPILVLALGDRSSMPVFTTTFIASALIIVRHRTNIERLLQGTENKLK